MAVISWPVPLTLELFDRHQLCAGAAANVGGACDEHAPEGALADLTAQRHAGMGHLEHVGVATIACLLNE